jgi:hypothetical protein
MPPLQLTVCVAVVAVLLLGVLARPLWTRQVSVFFDLGVFHLPLRDFYSRSLKSGEPFDWMPGMHTGLFLTGEGEHGPYHPLHLLLYRFLPLDVAFAAECFLAYPLMLLGTFVFLRRSAGSAGALLGGLVYAFSTNNISHGIHPNYVTVMAHLPWLLWLLERIALTAGSRRWLAASGVALLTGSQVLLGHPQAMSWSLLAEVLYAVFLLPSAAGRWSAGLAWAVGKALGLAIGGVQLLATFSFLADSNRGTFDPLFGGIAPSRLVQLLVPDVLSLSLTEWRTEPAYFGAVPLALLLWWLGARRTAAQPGTSRLTWYAITLGVLATWLALGSYGGLYLLQTHLPLVGQFRAPARYMNLTAFAAAILAGVGFGALARRVSESCLLPARHLTLPWLIAGAAVVAGFILYAVLPSTDRHGLDRRFLGGPLLLLITVSALTLAVRGRSVGLYGLVLLTGFDLYHFSLANPQWGEPLWREATTLSAWQATADGPPDADGRVMHLGWQPGPLLLRGGRLVNGYRGGLEPRKRLDYADVAALRLAGAAWYHEAPLGLLPVPAGLEAVGDGWHRVPDPLPRVRLVGRAVAGDDLAGFPIETTALTTHTLDLEGGPAGTALLTEERPGRLTVEAYAPARQLLVVSESYDPGWQAMIDGVPGTVERINGDFLGCVVDRGLHRVELTFSPTSIRWGKALSLTGLTGCALLAGLAVCLRRRPIPGCDPGTEVLRQRER